MLRSLTKALHRRALTFASTSFGFTVLVLVLWSLSFEMVWILSPTALISGGLRGSNAPLNFTQNIGERSSSAEMVYEPIDAVYTWVNGSDPVWLEKKKRFMKSTALRVSAQSIGGNYTMSGNETEASIMEGNTTNAVANVSVPSDVNRYRDSGELRYSLRSLIKNAPWIRRIYLVTDNQVPSWLNLESDLIRIVTHTDIFPNHSHLPVFSSPAIEAHLHRIPGLSKKFIYFNDDVFLGAPTLPEDFTSVGGVQKFHFAWEVPKCAPGCAETWIGDGYCDRACNVSACNFDYPDCVNATSNSYSYVGGHSEPQRGSFCSKGCPDSWLGDRVCDTRCNNAECAWDMGDCGMDKVRRDFPGVAVRRHSHSQDSDSGQEENVLVVPFGTRGGFFDMSPLNMTITAVNHTESSVFRHAFLMQAHGLLLFTLETEENKGDGGEELPTTVHFHLTGHGAGALTQGANSSTTTETVSFSLVIERNLAMRYASRGFPSGTGRVHGFVSTCLSHKPEHFPLVKTAHVAERSFVVEGEEGSDVLRGVALLTALPTAFVDSSLTTSDLYVEVTLLRHHEEWRLSLPLCNVLGAVASEDSGFGFTQLYGGYPSKGRSQCPALLSDVLRDLNSQVPHETAISRHDPDTRALPRTVEGAGVVYMTILTPLPHPWGNASRWVQARVEVVHDIGKQLPSSSYRWEHGVPRRSGSTASNDSSGSEGSRVKMCLSTSLRWGGPGTVADPPDLEGENVTLALEVNATTHNTTAVTVPILQTSNTSVALNTTMPVNESTSDREADQAEGASPAVEAEPEDTYAKSLIHVNRLYTKAFGPENRKVPAHSPHMLDKEIVAEMQRKWPVEWEATSTHRVRSTMDMQYSFAYYHYVMNRNKAVKPNLLHFIRHEVDTDSDGYLNENEFRTLAALTRNTNFTELRECIFNESDPRNKGTASSPYTRAKRVGLGLRDSRTHLLPYGKATVDVKLSLYPTVQSVLRCKLIVDALHEHVDWPMLKPSHSIGREGDIAFEMISDNYTEALSQLDSIRMRKSRFICINDNMMNPSSEVQQALKDFFESLWPHPSPFELPEGRSNRLLHYDAILAERARKREQGLASSLRDHTTHVVSWIISACKPALTFFIDQGKGLVLAKLLAASEVFSAHLRGLGATDSDPIDAEIKKYRAKVMVHPQRDSMTNLELTTVSVVCLLAAITIAWLFRRSRRANSARAEEEEGRRIY